MKLTALRGHASGFRAASSFLDHWFPTPRFLEPPAVGVDISDVSVKWIAFDSTRRVRSFGTLPLEKGIVVGGVIKDVDSLAEVLGTLRLKYGIREAHAALPEETAYVFAMGVPDGTSRDQILRMVEFEFEGRVPVSPKASVYDFDLVSGYGEGNMRDIGIVVFPRDLAGDYVGAFEKAGIRLLSLEIEARSIARAVHSSERTATDGVSLLVDFGRLRSGIAVLRRGIPIFTATVEIGGEAIEQGLMKCLSCTVDEAEAFRNEVGLTADAASQKTELEVMSSTASALADEVSRYYHFWDTHKNERGERATPVSRVILVGGSSNLRGLPEYIAARVQTEAACGDVWRNVFSYDNYIPPINRRASLGYATAIGLAMRGIQTV